MKSEPTNPEFRNNPENFHPFGIESHPTDRWSRGSNLSPLDMRRVFYPLHHGGSFRQAINTNIQEKRKL